MIPVSDPSVCVTVVPVTVCVPKSSSDVDDEIVQVFGIVTLAVAEAVTADCASVQTNVASRAMGA